MFSRFRQATKSRATRKFFRNRLAVVGLGVILCFFAAGLWVLAMDAAKMVGDKSGWYDLREYPLLDAMTVQQADQVVGPTEVPGFFLADRPEKRLRFVDTYLDEFRKATGRRIRDKVAALQAIRFAEMRPAEETPEELAEIVARASVIYDELAQSADLDKDPALLPKLVELEKVTATLFRPLSSTEAFLYKFRMVLGTDRDGRSIMVRAMYSVKVAIQIGLVVSFAATLLGGILGSAAAFFGGWVDAAVVWLYSTLSSLPDLVLLGVLVFMFTGSMFDDVTRPYLSLIPLYVAMSLTFWIGPCRVTRGEVMKIRELEYIQAATAIGFSRWYILLKHAFPNTIHLMFINFSLLFIAAIKNEVVLSFLGLGVKVGPSWGRMIQDSTAQVINGFFWQIGAATVFMFGLVLAFNIVSDALQDAFDPKHVG
jgi:peptide/nickel transport system permease protein